MPDKPSPITLANKDISDSIKGSENDNSPLSNGAGQSVQSVSQSVAISVQDAGDTMRNIALVQTTALGVATQKFVESKDPTYIPVIDKCQSVMKESVSYWASIGTKGAEILEAYKKMFS
nr:hypothetical protein [uncultured Desulfobacter sp.]